MPKNIAKVKQEKTQEEDESFLEYNNRTYKSYISKGLAAPEFLDYQERQFIAAVDPDKKDDNIERTVTKIVRVKGIDYSSKKKERRDYIYYYENWFGNDWQGSRLPPVSDHVEGYYYEQDTNPIVERNRITGYKRTGEHIVYYIPFSKKAVDDIIEKSVGTDQETIIFTFISGALSYEFPYSKFVNSSFEELQQLLVRPGGPVSVIANEQVEESSSKALDKLAEAARKAAQEEIVFDKEENEKTLDKNVVYLEEKNNQKEQEENKNQEKERKVNLVKPAFGDYKK